MIDFNEIKYQRLDYDKTKEIASKYIQELTLSKNAEEFYEVFVKIAELMNQIETNADYADIRNMRNSKDTYFESEINFWNQEKEKFDLLFEKFYEICSKTPYQRKLLDRIPETFFSSIDYKRKLMSSNILEERKKEKELMKKYQDLGRTAIVFQKESMNLNALKKFCNSNNRKIRKLAHDTLNDFYFRHEEEYNSLLKELVWTRNSIARKLGFKSYAELSDIERRRFGYTRKDIEQFRNNILHYIVPLKKELEEIQKKNLQLKEIEYYDTIFFQDGDGVSYYKEKELLEKLKTVYAKIDSKLAMFYESMLESHFIDLLNSQDKVTYSITNYLMTYKLPVITGNFKGISADITTTNHEVGHAYQKYQSKNSKFFMLPILKYPTFEVAEMFSHAMELIPIPYLKDFFNEEDYKKFSYLTLMSRIESMPYIALVDHFQEEIYTHPESNFGEVWKRLSILYGEEKNIKGHENLIHGNFFFRQSHIFQNPFYYIDYALSYFGAISLWMDYENTKSLEKFENLAKEASDIPMLKLMKKYDLPNPFEERSMKSLEKFLKEAIHERL